MNNWRPIDEGTPSDTWIFVWGRLPTGELAEAPGVAYWHDDSGRWVSVEHSHIGFDDDPWEIGSDPSEWNIVWWMPIESPEAT